jgi:elongator complex protein 3
MNYKKKPIRTISGVAPITVALPPRGCNHGVCTYCPTLDAPQSYTPESPAVRRAIRNNYDAYNQVRSRVKTLNEMGHSTEKVELIVIGGTFLQYPEDFKEKFILGCYNGLNGKKSKTIEEAKKINEKTKNRMVALCIETRPDDCSKEQIAEMLSWGATRVEMGVQIIDDEIYKKINRGHASHGVDTHRMNCFGAMTQHGSVLHRLQNSVKYFGKFYQQTHTTHADGI